MRKRYARILTGLAIVLVAGSIVYCFWMGISATKLRRAYAALEADGRPMRMEDIVPPRMPDAENAALLYESAILLLRAQPASDPNHENLLDYLGDRSGKFVNNLLDANQRTELQKLLEQEAVDHALFAIRLGTQRPSCRFELDYDAGLSMRFPHLGDLRPFVQVLGAKARFEGESGRPEDAWDLALTQLKLADCLRTEPVIVSQLIRRSGIVATCRTIQRLCAVLQGGQEQYVTFQDYLKGLDDVTPVVRTFDTDRVVFGQTIFNAPASEQRRVLKELVTADYIFKSIPEFSARVICFKPRLLADHAAYLRAMHRLAGLVERPFSPEVMAAMHDVDNNVEEYHIVTRTLLPAAARVKKLHTEMMAKVHITRAGLALLEYRDTHGAFTETLDALGLDGIDDPFSHRPLVYQPAADGFVLYSIGSDLKDNGGTPESTPEVPGEEVEYDIVWRFPDQPTR